MTNLDERITTVEQQMAQMRQEWSVVQQTPLIQTRLLNALRDTQLEQGRDIAVLKSDVAVLKSGMALVVEGQHAIVGMLTQLIDAEDGR